MTPPNASPQPPRDWKLHHLWEFQLVRDVLVLLSVFGLLWLGYKLSIVTVPLLIALLLAYLFEPLVAWITRKRLLSRSGAALIIITLAATIIVVPVTFGMGFAVVKGASFASDVATNIARVQRSVNKPADEALRMTIPSGGWTALRNYIVELDEQAAASQPTAGEDARPGTTRDPERGAKSPTGEATGERGAGQPKRSAEELDAGKDAEASGKNETDADADSDFDPTALSAGNLGNADNPLLSSQTTEQQARTLTRQAVDWLRANAEQIGSYVGRRALGTGAEAVTVAVGLFTGLGFLGFSAFLTAFFFYTFCTGYGRVQEFWESLIPERRKGRVIDLVHKMDRVVAGFVRGRLTIVGILAVYMTVAYAVIGVPTWYILGPVIGLFFIAPFIHVVGVPIAMLLMWLEPSAMWADWQREWWWIVFAPIGVYVIAQLLDDYVLSPIIQGKSTNLDAGVILFASIAGGTLAGIYGLILAIPVAACIKILMVEVFWPRFRAWAKGKEPDFLPIGDKAAPEQRT